MHNQCYYKEANTIFAKSLKLAIKNTIKGAVNCHLLDDTLIVDIYGANNIIFKYTLPNLSSEIVQGLSSERLAQSIVKRYKQYITNLFFL